MTDVAQTDSAMQDLSVETKSPEEQSEKTENVTMVNKDTKEKKEKKQKKKKKKKKKKNKKSRPASWKRVQKELQSLLLNPTEGITACPITNEHMLDWVATLRGPEGTPYEGGKFFLSIKFGEDYPFKAPTIRFKTKIYHCNIKSSSGEICLDVLKDNYSPALTIEKILLSLCVLLQVPNPDDPLVADIAQIYVVDREEHDKTAAEWTRRYAMAGNNDQNQDGNE